jgi:predicted transcriptional regulator
MQGDVAVLDSTIRQLLRDHRKAKALTQATLAARLGLPQSFIAKIETGERRLTAVQELVAQVVTQLEQRYATNKASNRSTLGPWEA